MRRNILIAVVGLALVATAASFVFGPRVYASVINEDTVTVTASEVIDDDLFAGGEAITISGTVNGDVYLGGGTIDIDGAINGDLYASAGTITITGAVTQDVILGAGTVVLDGATIGDSAVLGAGTVTIDSDTTIGGGLLMGVGTADVAGSVTRGITAGAGTLALGGSVGNDVMSGVGQLTVKPAANITGDLTYESTKTATISDDAVIGGEVTHVLPQTQSMDVDLTQIWTAISVGLGIWGFIAAMIVGLLLIYLFPKTSDRVTAELRKNPGKTFLLGLVFLIVKPIAIMILFMTLIGIPLGLILLAMYLVMLYLARIYVGYCVGMWLLELVGQKKPNPYIGLLVGSFLFSVVLLIPIVGPLVGLLAMITAYGALLIQKAVVAKKIEK